MFLQDEQVVLTTPLIIPAEQRERYIYIPWTTLETDCKEWQLNNK